MKRLAWLGLLALVVAAVPAGASMFVGLTPHQMVAQSSAVVQGEVLKINSFWSTSGRVIVTEAMVRVTDTIVGDAPSVVVLRTFGGTVGSYNVIAEGFPKFNVGDNLLLFLQDQGDGTAEVTGYRQGQFKIVQGKSGAARAVPTLEPGVALLTPDGRHTVRPVAVDLETFKAQIRAEAVRAVNRTANQD